MVWFSLYQLLIDDDAFSWWLHLLLGVTLRLGLHLALLLILAAHLLFSFLVRTLNCFFVLKLNDSVEQILREVIYILSLLFLLGLPLGKCKLDYLKHVIFISISFLRLYLRLRIFELIVEELKLRRPFVAKFRQ